MKSLKKLEKFLEYFFKKFVQYLLFFSHYRRQILPIMPNSLSFTRFYCSLTTPRTENNFKLVTEKKNFFCCGRNILSCLDNNLLFSLSLQLIILVKTVLIL